MIPPRAWILPGDGVGTWKAENNGSAEMVGAVEYVPVSELERLLVALWRIVEWSDAYPTQVFPEPDFARAAAALSVAGMSLDVVSASNMRHATKGIGEIARAALKGDTP